MTKTSAPGKVILLGEHAAVYGNPVLVATVDLRTRVFAEKRDDNNFIINAHDINVTGFKFKLNEIPDLKTNERVKSLRLIFNAIEKVYDYAGVKNSKGLEISIKSDIPVSSGLGSSASLSSALVLAVSSEIGRELNKEDIANLAWDIEHCVHGKSSGVDPFAVTYGGICRYTKGRIEKLNVKNYPEITIGNTGVVSDTGIVVSDVMKLKENFPDIFDKLLLIFRELVDEGQNALEKGDLKKFGGLMNMNHGMLSAIGVSCIELEKLVYAARKKSIGAKLCGAGRGGVMMALGDLTKEIKNAGGEVIKTGICDEGVRIDD